MNKQTSIIILLTILWHLGAIAQSNIRIIATSDVHGNYLPYDFIYQKPWEGGLSRVATYVKEQRKALGEENVLLLDNGDILQGQPTAYYYNYMDSAEHFCASALNYLRYDVGGIGNHDVETGHAVYDRWVRQCHFPMVCANAIDTKTGKTYWKPYTVVERNGMRIAVLGLLTPAIPQWLPENLWAGLRFEDMVATARQWMPILREKEKADIVVGLFHSGVGSATAMGHLKENASLQVAQQVPGFDVIFCGHDHRVANMQIVNVAGDTVVVLNPGANAFNIAQADITVNKKVNVKGDIVKIETLVPDADYLSFFKKQYETVNAFTQEKIGRLETRLETRSAYFGSSAFIDLIHDMQLQLTKADLSFAAPLSLDATIEAGYIRVSDMFNLYKFENLLYTMSLSGKEIKNYLEYSYDKWVRTMENSRDTMLYFRKNVEKISEPWQRLQNVSYNFDCAGGLIYTVDLRKTKGQRIDIKRFADGRDFDLDAKYKVAVNSYRGNGGGGLLTEGAGIAKDSLSSRILWSTERDLRYYLMQTIRAEGTLCPKAKNEWKFIPASWVKKARLRDERILFQSN